jgi:hypothetical protein
VTPFEEATIRRGLDEPPEIKAYRLHDEAHRMNEQIEWSDPDQELVQRYFATQHELESHLAEYDLPDPCPDAEVEADWQPAGWTRQELQEGVSLDEAVDW